MWTMLENLPRKSVRTRAPSGGHLRCASSRLISIFNKDARKKNWKGVNTGNDNGNICTNNCIYVRNILLSWADRLNEMRSNRLRRPRFGIKTKMEVPKYRIQSKNNPREHRSLPAPHEHRVENGYQNPLLAECPGEGRAGPAHQITCMHYSSTVV